jgi:hypothetical protein
MTASPATLKMPRRRPRATVAPMPDGPPTVPMVTEPEVFNLECGIGSIVGRRLRVTVQFGPPEPDDWTPPPGWTVKNVEVAPVPRWEDPEFCEGEQPRPIKTEVNRYQEENGKPYVMIWRYWRPDDVPRCRLCAVCNAAPCKLPSMLGTLTCFTSTDDTTLTEFKAALLSQRPSDAPTSGKPRSAPSRHGA